MKKLVALVLAAYAVLALAIIVESAIAHVPDSER